MIEELLEAWDGEHAVIRFDAESGTWMFVCVHSSRPGPAGGGTRMKPYPTPAEGLRDAMRLAAGMTRKFAVLGLPYGGGKAVLAVPAVPEGPGRRRLLERYGDLVESLGGGFLTGPDVNTSSADMDVIGERTGHVFCRTVGNGGSGDPSTHTALGVFHGIRASVRHVFGTELAGRTVLVQGAGSVGGKLVALLAEAGATTLVSDVDDERARATGGTVVAAADAIGTECDVYAPCALGATLSAESIPQLRCRVVAGAANNQLETAADAARLRDAGILYAPDYVINGGGALHGIGLEHLGWTSERLDREVERIGDTLLEIYGAADAEGITTAEAAERLAAERLRALDVPLREA